MIITHRFTLLHMAAWHGSVRCVRELLRLGADGNRPNAIGIILVTAKY